MESEKKEDTENKVCFYGKTKSGKKKRITFYANK